ncbi:enolase [Streptococcus pneumoniae]|nr:enolase [Streptococcus pneumoniae]
MKIINGICRYIFDSKGFATIEVEIFLDSGDTGIGAAPRGSTTGHYDIQYNEYYPRGNNFSPIPDGNIEFFRLYNICSWVNPLWILWSLFWVEKKSHKIYNEKRQNNSLERIIWNNYILSQNY